MKEKSTCLILAVFNGMDNAETALTQLKKRDRDIKSAVIMQKDAEEHVQFKDVGLTPRKGAAGGIVLGGVVGVLTGGTGLALAALGGVVGSHSTKKKQAEHLAPEQLSQVAGSLGPDSSAIVAVSQHPLKVEIASELADMGAELFQVAIQPEMLDRLDDHADEAYAVLLEALAEKTGGQARLSLPYARIHVVINPASGKKEPILSVLNSVFGHYGVEWDVSITHKYGDATEFARRAAESGDFDLVAGYGGDGTQMEVANGLMGSGIPMAILPGGTGNAMAFELKVPRDLRLAAQLIVESGNRRTIDLARIGDRVFMLRMYTGKQAEDAASREMKDKYGNLAYVSEGLKVLRNLPEAHYYAAIDGEKFEGKAMICYIFNAGASGGVALPGIADVDVSDGLLDLFVISKEVKPVRAVSHHVFMVGDSEAGVYHWQGREITIEADPPQSVWIDGEAYGQTPVTVQVIPQALQMVVPYQGL